MRSTGLRVVAGLLTAALCIEAMSRWVGGRFSHDLADVVVPLKQQWIESGRANADIVFLGDSFVKSGIEPSVVREITGHSTINLGTNIFVTLLGQHLMIERLLKAHRPMVLVFLTDTDSLRQEIESDEGRYYLAKTFLMPAEIGYLLRETRNASLFLAQAVNFLFPIPSLYYRNVVQGAMGNILRALPRRDWTSVRSPGYPVAEAVRTFETNDGMFPLEHERIGFGRISEGPFEVNPLMARELDRILDFARTAGVSILFGFNPIPESVRAWRSGHGFEDAFHAFVADLRERHPGAVYLDPILPAYPDAEFYDRRHLLRQASRRHSAWIAARIRPLLPENRQP